MKYYKVLDATGRSCHGGTAEWSLPRGKRPGKWMPSVAVDPCHSGYHVCEPRDLLEWLGPRIWVVELRGEVVRADGKTVAAQARLVAPTPWDDRRARLYAADCAARVLHLYERRYPEDHRPRRAIDATRQFARGEIWAAARDAAWAAAWAAARDAAKDAARDAARAAAWAADWNAAGAAAGDAARAAAGNAEREWQTRRLLRYLQPTEPRPVPLAKGGE